MGDISRVIQVTNIAHPKKASAFNYQPDVKSHFGRSNDIIKKTSLEARGIDRALNDIFTIKVADQ